MDDLLLPESDLADGLLDRPVTLRQLRALLRPVRPGRWLRRVESLSIPKSGSDELSLVSWLMPAVMGWLEAEDESSLRVHTLGPDFRIGAYLGGTSLSNDDVDEEGDPYDEGWVSLCRDGFGELQGTRLFKQQIIGLGAERALTQALARMLASGEKTDFWDGNAHGFAVVAGLLTGFPKAA